MTDRVTAETSVSVLDRWQHLAATPRIMNFPAMELMARDFEPPIVKGSGEIRFNSPRDFEFTLRGLPEDAAYALRQLRRQRENSYDGLNRFRLFATAPDGTKFVAGWTIPDVKPAGAVWTFSGDCEGLMTDDPSVPSSPTGGTEVQYIIPRQHRASLFLEHFVSTPRSDGGTDPRYELDLGDAVLTFRFDPDAGLLTVSAPGSELLPLTLTESWIGEPLRILFGQIISPHMTARSFPKGGAMVRISRTPVWHRDSDAAALWGDEDLTGKERFWNLYGDLLLHIARAGGFEGHTITKYYEEVLQAARGSRWVWALTFASSIEGLIRILSPRGAKRGDADQAAIDSMIEYISKWRESNRPKETVDLLKSVATRALLRTADVTPKYVLTQLCRAGIVTQFQVDAWNKIRNSVMHGELVSPYSSEDDDALLLALAALLHALTQEVVRPTVVLT